MGFLVHMPEENTATTRGDQLGTKGSKKRAEGGKGRGQAFRRTAFYIFFLWDLIKVLPMEKSN